MAESQGPRGKDKNYAKEGNYMLDGQNIAVDHLVTIIQALQIGRTTGSLMVTRGEGTSYESGTLVFLNGRVVQARVGTSGDAAGGREGRAAFNWLSTWEKCRYTFVLSITSHTKLRSEKQSDVDARSGARLAVRLVPLNATRNESATGSLSGGDQNQFVQQEGKASRKESELVNETVPYRSKPLEYSLHVLSKKSLSRMHRNVFLLVDGARKVRDLMRLLTLNENEIRALLHDLQNTGVISLAIPLSL
jgi:hypothetical protein